MGALVQGVFFNWTPQKVLLVSKFWHFIGPIYYLNKIGKYLRSLSRKSRASGETRCWFSECTKRSHLEKRSYWATWQTMLSNIVDRGARLTFSCCACQGCRRSVGRARSGTCPSTRTAPRCQAPALDNCTFVLVSLMLFFSKTESPKVSIP